MHRLDGRLDLGRARPAVRAEGDRAVPDQAQPLQAVALVGGRLVDDALEVAILTLLSERSADASICPSEAARRVAGDDASAKATVLALARDMGFTPRDAGPLRNAAVLENLAVLWIHLATQSGMGRQFYFAFKTP